MSVKLIAKTVPVGIDCNSEEFIAYVARVSNTGNQNNHKTGQRLVSYLMRNKHWSPFEMVSAVLEITTTRDITHQIIRHRSFAFQEFSQRYSSEIEFAEPREVRLQDVKNRQNSIESDDESARIFWSDVQADIAAAAEDAYRAAIKLGIAKEVARAILPEGLTVSRLYMAGSIRSWLHYVDVRTDPSTQKEHRIVAEQCRTALAEHFPSVFGGP